MSCSSVLQPFQWATHFKDGNQSSNLTSASSPVNISTGGSFPHFRRLCRYSWWGITTINRLWFEPTRVWPWRDFPYAGSQSLLDFNYLILSFSQEALLLNNLSTTHAPTRLDFSLSCFSSSFNLRTSSAEEYGLHQQKRLRPSQWAWQFRPAPW